MPWTSEPSQPSCLNIYQGDNGFYFIHYKDGGERQLIDVYQKSADDILNLIEIAGAATERFVKLFAFFLSFQLRKKYVIRQNMLYMLYFFHPGGGGRVGQGWQGGFGRDEDSPV